MDSTRRSCPAMLLRLAWLACLVLALAGPGARAAGNAVLLDLDGAIGVATADYVRSGLDHAAASDAQLVILRMDTPGGLVNSMRDIVKVILASPVPVATYVAPAGARADSAGTYILLASHVAAMAPTTHLGAATPVSITGDDIAPGDLEDLPGDGEDGDRARNRDRDADDEPANDEPAVDEQNDPDTRPSARGGTAMENKVLNDAVAYIRALAQRHGRNADWAEKAVLEAATLTAAEALELNVIEYIADDENDLLAQLDGQSLAVGAETVVLETGGSHIEAFEPNWRIKLLSVISNPEIVLILGMIGLYGLMYEGWNPGAIVPGVVGVICLLLAAYALQVIPVNYAGLALLVVGVGLMVAEAFAPSFGALGLGGIAAFVFGAIMMFDSGVPGYDISLAFVIALAALAAIAIVWTLTFVLKLRRRGAVSGKGSIVGGIGTAMEDFSGSGKVWLEGEAWSAVSTHALAKGQAVIVRRLDGLTLTVEPLPATSPVVTPPA